MSQSAGAQVLFVTRDPELNAHIDTMQSQGIETHAVATHSQVFAYTERAGDFVTVFDGNLPVSEAYRSYQLLRNIGPAPLLILVDADAAQKLTLGAGAHATHIEEYVARPVDPEELALRAKALMIRAGYRVPQPPTAVAPADSMRAQATSSQRGELVAVFSPKGGAGKSTIATNLAVGLAQLPDQSTLLVDADLWSGDVSVLLDISARNSILDVCVGELTDPDALRGATVRHGSGLQVLQRPRDLTAVEQLDTSHLLAALSIYRTLFDRVVVNMSPSLEEFNLQLLDLADRILVVTTPDLPTTHSTSRFLALVHKLGYGERVRVILNRADSGIHVAAVQGALGFPVWTQVASDGRLAVQAANEGLPIMLRHDAEHSALTRDLRRLVAKVAGNGRVQEVHRPIPLVTRLQRRLLGSLQATQPPLARVPVAA